MKNQVNIIGMKYIIFRCAGSAIADEVIICWISMVAPIRIGVTKYGSFTERSRTQSMNGACRSSMAIVRMV